MEIRHGHALVTAEDVLLLPIPEIALRMLAGLVEQSENHFSTKRSWSLDWIVRNAEVRWRERGFRDVETASQKYADALSWLVSNALLSRASESNEWRLSDRGRKSAKQRSIAEVQAERRLALDLHPMLSDARSIFSLGTHDAAVLEAMKQVEDRVRQLSGLSGHGTDLINRALAPGKTGTPDSAGPLADPAPADPQEARGIRDLFAGAVAAFRNPAAHRSIDYSDSSEAAEVVLLADLLLRILDRTERRQKASDVMPS